MALLGQFGRRAKSSGFRGEADMQRTCSDLPRLALVGPTVRGAARQLMGEELTNSARPDDFRP